MDMVEIEQMQWDLLGEVDSIESGCEVAPGLALQFIYWDMLANAHRGPLICSEPSTSPGRNKEILGRHLADSIKPCRRGVNTNPPSRMGHDFVHSRARDDRVDSQITITIHK